MSAGSWPLSGIYWEVGEVPSRRFSALWSPSNWAMRASSLSLSFLFKMSLLISTLYGGYHLKLQPEAREEGLPALWLQISKAMNYLSFGLLWALYYGQRLTDIPERHQFRTAGDTTEGLHVLSHSPHLKNIAPIPGEASTA